MSVNVLFAGSPSAWEAYRASLRAACDRAGVAVQLAPNHPPEETDYIVYGTGCEIEDFSPFVRTKAVLRLWAGVEGIVKNPTLTQPLARMVGGGLDEGMVEWVTGHVLRHHLGMDAHILGQDGVWRNDICPPLARDRKVTILGIGALGSACACALSSLGFQVTGWSRSQKDIAGVRCLSGAEGLDQALEGAEILVLLVPLTAATENLLGARTLGLLAPGAFVINPGRGALIDDVALLAALDSGQVAHATLDVFRTEPLPPEDPYWAHPKVTVTPHIASETRVDAAAEVVAENIRRGEAGEPFLHLVDRTLGY